MTQASSNGANTVTDILGLLGAAGYAPSRHNQVKPAADSGAVAKVSVEYELKPAADGAENGAPPAPATFDGIQLLGMLLAEVKSIADKKAGGLDMQLVLAVPDHYSPDRRAAAASAAIVGGFAPGSVSVVAAAEAAVAGWALKHPQAPAMAPAEGGDEAAAAAAAAEAEAVPENAARHVMIVDVGQSTGQATVFKVGRLTADGSPTFERLNQANTSTVFGVADVDEFVFDNIAAKLDSEYQVQVKPGTRRASRLLRECGKARKILSANELTEIVLECFDDQERDFQFKLSRADFDADCASLKTACSTLVSDALAASGISAEQLEAVELIGGGTRIQFVRKAIMEVVGEGKLSQTLDGAAAVALGATLLAPAAPNDDQNAAAAAAGAGAEEEEEEVSAPAPAPLSAEVAAFVALEVQMSAQDAMLLDIDAEKNALETFIYETRGAGDSEFKEHFDVDKTLPLLADAEDWLFGDEGDAIDHPGPAQEKLAELTANVAELNPNYLAAVEEARLKKEAEMEAERLKAAAEAAAAGPVDDHDSRKLKKADRMKFVTKNKAEGTDLFKGGNYLHAQNRCVLRHRWRCVFTMPPSFSSRSYGHPARPTDLHALTATQKPVTSSCATGMLTSMTDH